MKSCALRSIRQSSSAFGPADSMLAADRRSQLPHARQALSERGQRLVRRAGIEAVERGACRAFDGAEIGSE